MSDGPGASFPTANWKEALQRIEMVLTTGQISLDLGDLGLKDLPPEIGQLTWLQYLALGYVRLDVNGQNQFTWQYEGGRPVPTFTDLKPL